MKEGGRAFIHKGSKPAAKPFHYTQCGLDDVYLLGGITLRDTAYGKSFNIKNLDALHTTIGCTLVRDRKTLRAQDVRFLRKQLSVTQDELGQMIGVSGQQVARYEKGETPIPNAPEMLLRLRFVASIMPDRETIKHLKEIVAHIEAMLLADEMVPRKICLQATGDKWKAVRLAA